MMDDVEHLFMFMFVTHKTTLVICPHENVVSDKSNGCIPKWKDYTFNIE